MYIIKINSRGNPYSGRNSSKKPSVMETLKRKSSDTYLNAGKVSTNIFISNNNSSSSNNISSSSAVVASRGVSNSTEMPPSMAKPPQPPQQQASSLTSFNSDQKYLHKKFKRIASATSDNFENNNKHEDKAPPPPTPPSSSSSYENSSKQNSFSSANNSHHHTNNNNLINNFKVVQNHTMTPHNSSSSSSNNAKSVPQVMTAYENYIITKEKLTHHQVQQIDAKIAAAANSPETFMNNNHGKNSRPPALMIVNSHQDPSSYPQNESTPGRHVCPYCQLVCTKPSVLEKHIRAHTNERPYPCKMCGFAFKTKSNLHKHFKSRAHMSRERGEEPHPDDDMASYGSDGETTDKDTSNSGLDLMRRISPVDERTSSPLSQQSMDKPYKPKFHLYPGKAAELAPAKVASNKDSSSYVPTISTSTMTTSTPSVIQSKPPGASNFVLSASVSESVTQHIQKIISQNAAIIEGVDPALQKKYHKITGINRSISVDNSIGSSSSSNTTPNVTRKSSLSIPPRELSHHHHANNNNNIQHSATVPPSPASMPNNIVIVAPKTPGQMQYQSHTQLIHPLQATPHSVQIIQQPIMFNSSAPASSVTATPSNVPSSPQQTPLQLQVPLNLATKPQEMPDNSPRSRKTSQETEQVPVVDHPKNPERSIIKDLLLNSRTFGVVAEGETNETGYICPTCKKVFQNADVFKYHQFVACDGSSLELQPQQHYIDEQGPQSAPISPVASPHQYIRSNSLHIASLDKHGKVIERIHGNPAKIIKPRLSRQKPDNIIITQSNVSPVIEGASIDQFHLIPQHHKNLIEMTQAPLPSPGPLLGKTPLIDMYSMHGSQVIERKMSLSEIEELHYQQQQQMHSASKRARYNNDMRGRVEKMQMFGGDVKILEKSPMGQFSSGGTMSSLSPNSDEMNENAPVMVTGLHSGGMAVPMHEKDQKVHEKLPMTPKLVLTITPTLTITQPTQSLYQQKTHFQFPPLNAITGYNPLTLPPATTTSSPQVQSIMHGGKLIPHVPGIPGPNTFNPKVENLSKNIMPSPKTPVMPSSRTVPSNNLMISPRSVPQIKLEPFDDGYNVPQRPPSTPKQSFNFSRIADNISPSKKGDQEESKAASVVKLHSDDVRIFNYENVIAKNEIIVRPGDDVKPSPKVKEESRPNKFLRPSSLPLKPGTFTPKQHHGITPTANTLPLISPETPRPSKTCVQQYHNGHAYTYLGLKCSTKPFYCTVNKPQPAYCVTQAKLSMYSNWQVYPESKPHPLNLKPLDVMLCYRSSFKFERNRKFTIAKTQKMAYTLVKSTETRVSAVEAPTRFPKFAPLEEQVATNNGNATQEEEYVRGRGRGKYVCETCGIKCKKPSMLKKHIRTHTDERPHTCTNCNFSFKTKGNLTKHMKSKAHYKKCIELGIPYEEYQGSEGDNGSGEHANAMTTGFEDESENENDSDCDEDTESDDNEENRSRLPEHEAARCLLSLSMTPPATNLISNQPAIDKTDPPRLDEISCRRIITFAAPKTEFDLHGQYYSDPNLVKINERQETAAPPAEAEDCPIDLTKRSKNVPEPAARKKPAKVSDVIMPINGSASELASLMSITDKFPFLGQNGEHFVADQNILPHKYITDRALLDTKIKQSQKIIQQNSSQEMPMQENPRIEHVAAQTIEQPRVVDDEPGISMMDTLAEVAASSVKLDVTPIHSPKMPEDPVPKVENDSRNFNAKSIATEFLKLTQNVKNSSENDGEGESGSDQDAQKFNVNRTVVVGPGAFNAVVNKKVKNDAKPFMQDEGRPLCHICKKVFPKQSALKLHLNIHAMERKYKCGPCGQGFRTQGHLQKHNRSAQHQTKVSMTSTFGVPSQSNPRPFKCKDCGTQFRIHGHLAKHLRSKLHVMRLECLGKLPIGLYAEIEKSGISLTNIDTSDCDTSLASLLEVARKIHEDDPTKLNSASTDQSNNNTTQRPMENMDEENGESDGEYPDSADEGHADQENTKEPINGLKRTYLNTFGDKIQMHESDSDKDPLKLDTPPPRPIAANMHDMNEKRFKTDFHHNNDS
ncbi:uncharacterized protein LOC134832164 isoform X2 [Culicoides brevitarsis]|uniref:uncharacterized protein LOC134832164 isoform X2 n=1 Tax=Culicoides brevitarsis TaxID=469753 RepID=UPI00307C31E1